MRASARLAVARDPSPRRPRTRITRLRSDPPLVLRPTITTGPAPLPHWTEGAATTAHVALVSAAAGPIGGDHLRLHVEVGPGASLILRGVAATLLLPGPHGEPSLSEITISLGPDATLVWLPGPLIAVRGCAHRATTQVHLAAGARLLVREELLLGRHSEPAGSIYQRLRVCLDDRPLHDQELRVGPDAPGSVGPAVTGGRRAVGSSLLVDPTWADVAAFDRPSVTTDRTAARLPLPGPGILFTALAPDLVALRQRTAARLAQLEEESRCDPGHGTVGPAPNEELQRSPTCGSQ